MFRKKNSMTRIKYCFIIFFVCLFISCATTLNVQVKRPAKLDLNGAKTIAVLPFSPYQIKNSADAFSFIIDTILLDYNKCSPDEKKCLDKLKNEIEIGLSKSPYISLINSLEVQSAIKNNYLNPADVYLTGEVINFFIDDIIHKTEVPVDYYDIDEEGNKKKRTEYKEKIEFSRNVKLELVYQVVDSSTGIVISYKSADISKETGYYDKKSELPSAYSVLEYQIIDLAKKILQELQPYMVNKSIKLLKDKSKNPDMKNADKLAKKNCITESYNEFIRIYRETELFEAGYNAAVLQLALGKLNTAKEIMEELYNKSFDKRALDALSDINNEIYQAQRLKNQIEKQDEYLP